MEADADGAIITFVFTGNNQEDIPQNATRLVIDKSVTSIPMRSFREHPNLIELICHDGVTDILERAFYGCPRLKRLIIRGVENIWQAAFQCCGAIDHVECPKLRNVWIRAFSECISLKSIDLPSARYLEVSAFKKCLAMTHAKIGNKVERLSVQAFFYCRSMERVTLSLKSSGRMPSDGVFMGCDNLKHVDLLEGEVLRETIDALLCEEWKDDMNKVIDSINRTLPRADAGGDVEINHFNHEYYYTEGEKALRIREWMSSILRKIIEYKAEHRRYVGKGAAEFQTALPSDVMKNNVLPFLALPSHSFDGE